MDGSSWSRLREELLNPFCLSLPFLPFNFLAGVSSVSWIFGCSPASQPFQSLKWVLSLLFCNWSPLKAPQGFQNQYLFYWCHHLSVTWSGAQTLVFANQLRSVLWNTVWFENDPCSSSCCNQEVVSVFQQQAGDGAQTPSDLLPVFMGTFRLPASDPRGEAWMFCPVWATASVFWCWLSPFMCSLKPSALTCWRFTLLEHDVWIRVRGMMGSEVSAGAGWGGGVPH